MDSTVACLTDWMPRQRWYSATTTPRLRVLASHELASDDPGARVRVLVVADESVTPPPVYQVPVVARTSPGPGVSPDRVIGVVDGATLIDGADDPAYQGALLEQLVPGAAAPATVLVGEQSNTSVIYAPAAGTPVIAKVFRRLQPGLHPDIELQTALAEAGSTHVPGVVGHIDTHWSDPADAAVQRHGAAVFAQEFFPDVEDAWRVALVAAAAGDPFTGQAHALGAATAEVHLALARVFPCADAGDLERAAIRSAWERRLRIAVDEVPDLAPLRRAVEDVYARVEGVAWPRLQRIHGDLHLGQVLQVPGRGWVLLDFEGEPMRPIDERRAPDAAARDVAGMLRSFDYIAGALPELPHVADWAIAARRAFLGGYQDRAGIPATGPLLDAFELDKAVYEAIYEARNRPDWIGIPLAAVERLTRR